MISSESYEDLISVIVPVYNVEPYLQRCIDSILAQTYSFLEIILVDDGSTDKSGKICETYAKQDGRIKVIHQPNGGLSSARNRGISLASGTLIGLVDSDDFIDSDMYRLLYQCLRENQADIAICGYYEVDGNDMRVPYCQDKTVVYTREEAIKSLVSESTFKNYAWNKLYKKELFYRISYPQGHNMEDLATTYKIFQKADRIVCINHALYYYVVNRPGSILSEITLKTLYDLFDFHKQRYDDLKEDYPVLEDLLFHYIIGAALRFCAQYRVGSDFPFDDRFCFILRYLKENKKQILQNGSIDSINKMRIRVLFCHVNLLHVFDSLTDCLRKIHFRHMRSSFCQCVWHHQKGSKNIPR